jgi:hypothetical protein
VGFRPVVPLDAPRVAKLPSAFPTLTNVEKKPGRGLMDAGRMKHHYAPAADTLSALANLDLLRWCPLEDLERMAHDSDIVRLPAGRVIDHDRTRARQFIGVLDGYVSGTARDGREIVLGPGEQFGASELIDAHPHTMTYTTATPATVVATFGPTFNAIGASIPGVADAARSDVIRRAETTPNPLVASVQ